MITSLDIETFCLIASCDKSAACEHALFPHTAGISKIGVYYYDNSRGAYSFHSFNSTGSFRDWLGNRNDVFFIGHHLAFDLKHLAFHGLDIPLSQWQDDTKLLASVCLEKIPATWLTDYAEKRDSENKKLPPGSPRHRPGSPLSLKTLAPYFLGVDPFWENPLNHDDEVYLEKDCRYTYELWAHLMGLLEDQHLRGFYEKRLLPWAKMLLTAEMRGIAIDMAEIQKLKAEAESQSLLAEQVLDGLWAVPNLEMFEHKRVQLECELRSEMNALLGESAPEKHQKIELRYQKKYLTALDKIPSKVDFNSPKQLAEFFKDHLHLDIRDYNEEETTGKEVLQRLASEGRADIATFLSYRENQKLATAFFPTYESLQHQGVLRPSFDLSGTRTGRLSCRQPNLQQVPAELHHCFIPRRGYKLVTRDLSTIEPRIAAYYTEDPTLCGIFLRDGDFHSANAILMFGLSCAEKDVKKLFPLERDIAKTVGLAILYGAGWRRIQQTAMKAGHQWSDDKCKDLCYRLRDAYPVARRYKENLDATAKTGSVIYNIMGRGHRYDDPQDVHMKAFNTLCQSSASDLMLEGTRRAVEALKHTHRIEAHPLLWVHDECVWEIAEDSVNVASEIIEANLLGFNLKTRHGVIPLKCEGACANFWSK